MNIKYSLPSGRATFSGFIGDFGGKDYTMPSKKKDVIQCLKEALEELAKKDLIVKQNEEEEWNI